jgi:DNA-binding NtrC family response regulator
VECGRFRLDLYYRIKVVTVKVPPLRERREEIPLLANLFAKRFAAEFSKSSLRFSDDAMELLVLHSWPGNIRQLANEIRRLAALTDDSALVTPGLLSPELFGPRISPQVEDPSARRVSVSLDQPLTRAVETLEREMLARTLDECGGQVTNAARKLGLSRKGLYLKRRRLGLVPERLPDRTGRPAVPGR